MPYPGSIDAMTFGQFGSIYLDQAATTIKPPTNKLITAITMLEETQFTSLVAKDSAQSFNTVAGGAGTNGETLASDSGLPSWSDHLRQVDGAQPYQRSNRRLRGSLRIETKI